MIRRRPIVQNVSPNNSLDYPKSLIDKSMFCAALNIWLSIAGLKKFAAASRLFLIFGVCLIAIGKIANAADSDEPAERLPRRPLFTMPEQFEPEGKSEETDFQPFTDRWRVVPPPYEVNVKGSLWD